MRFDKIVATVCAIALAAGCGRDKAADAAESDAPAESTASTAASSQQYPTRSGIIESRATGMLDAETTVYFDDGGTREATYTTSVMKFGNQTITTKSAEIRDGEWFYTYKEDENHWVRWSAKSFGSAAPAMPGGNANSTASLMNDAMKGSADAKELPARTIAGKEASGMEMEMMGMKIRMWMWENIPLRSEVEMGSEPTITEVTSLQLGVPVPADKFRPPAGATIVDWKN